MTLPAFGAATILAATTAASVAVPVPAGVVADTVVIVDLYRESTAAVTAPTGWTEITPAATTATIPTDHQRFWHRATGAESGSYTFSWTGSTWCQAAAVSVTGCVTTGSPDDVSQSAGRDSAGTVTPAVSVTTTGPDRFLVWAGMNDIGGDWTPPTGFTTRAGATGSWLTMATLGQAAAGSSGSLTGTCTGSSQESAFLTALLPVASTVAKSGSDTATGTDTATVGAAPAGLDTAAGADTGSTAAQAAGADTATGSDLGAIALAGSDTATGTDSGAVSIPVGGADTATGTDSGAITAASLTGTDTAAGLDSGAVAAQVTAGLDTAAGSDGGAVAAQLGGADTASGLDGGFTDTAFGDLNISLWAVDPTSGALAPLPDFANLTLSPVRNAPGAISVDYPADGINYQLLRNNITDDRDTEIEIWLTGSQTGRLRGYLTDTAIDEVSEDRRATFTGGFLELRMGEDVVRPQVAPLGNDKQELVLNAASAGTVMTTLIGQSQADGVFTDLTLDFTGAVDSAGVAWPLVISTKYSPGAGYMQVLDDLVAYGLCEWAISADHVLHLWRAGGRGVDRTVGLHPVILRHGRNILDAPRKHSVRTSSTAVLVAGGANIYKTAVDVTAQTRRGRKIVSFSTANNLTDPGSVTAFAAAELAVSTPGQMEVTHGIGSLTGEPLPGTAYALGDWVFSDTAGSLERLRVAQWSLTITNQQGAVPTGTTSLNDLTVDALAAQEKRLNALASGSAVVGTSGTGVDNSTPNPPTALSATSVAFLDGAAPKASVTVSWAAPTNNTDGTTLNDLGSYVIQFALASEPTLWASGGTAAAAATSGQFTTTPGLSILIRVAALDYSGHQSAWSATLAHTTTTITTAPPTPSTPTAANYLGVLLIGWDGKGSVGQDMLAAAPNFSYVEVHLSTASGYTPSSTTYVGRLYAAGQLPISDLPYGVTQFAKLVAVDNTTPGNKSAASAAAARSTSQVVSADLFAGCVGSVALASLAVKTANIDVGAVNTLQCGAIGVGVLTAGIFSAAMTLSGIIKTADTGARSEIDGAGIRLYNATALTVNFATADGSALVTGQYQTALSGQRLVLNPGGTVPDTINIYPSGSGDFARIMARTAPGDGSAAVLIDGGAAATIGRGRLGAYKSEAFVSWVTSDAGGDSSSGYSQTAVSCNATGINTWVQDRINFDRYNGSTYVSDGHTYLLWTTGSGSSYCPTLTANAPGVNAGIKFDSGAVLCTINEGAAFGACKASAFTVSSTAEVKVGVVDIAQVLSPLAHIRAAKAKAYRYADEVAHLGDAAPLRFGPLAEDLPPQLVHMTPPAAGGPLEPSVSLGDQIGVLWGAIGQLADTMDALTARLPKPAGGP